MNIGINALHIKWGVNAGTETYLTNIIIPWYEEKSSSNKYFLFCTKRPPWWKGIRNHFNIIEISYASNFIIRVLFEQIILPITHYRKLDVLYSPGYVGCLTKKKQVITIPDTFAWKYPQEIGKLRSIYWKTIIPLSAKKAKKIISISNSTSKDIEKFNITQSCKIVVIKLGGSQLISFLNDSDILKRLSLKKNEYYMCVGFFKNIKNPRNILKAYNLYYKKSKNLSYRKLVLVGRISGDKAKKILNIAKQTKGVVIAGRVNNTDLAVLYKNSAGLIFVSLYEGFGIPILEAQSFSCPVVTSSLSSMPEVVGKGGIIVNPLNPEEIADAMMLLYNKVLLKKLKIAGKENLGKFSWKKASDETLKLLIEVGKNG